MLQNLSVPRWLIKLSIKTTRPHHLGECSALQQGAKARVRSHRCNQQIEDAKNLQKQLSYIPFNAQWSYLKRKEHLLGLHRNQLMNMSLFCISLPLGMLSLSGTAGHYKICHHTVIVVTHSALNMY